MLKLYILLALAVAGVSGQVGQPQAGSEAAPEPYSYGYETDSHSAAEQRDPSGKVTGFYTIVDADGRQRRVEYIADEAGFRAKVQTNEVGTKSENSADVEIQSSPPTEAQLAPVPVQAAPQVQRVQQQVVQAAPARSQAISYQTVQQQPGNTGYGYYGYGAYPAGYGYNGYASGQNSQYGQYGQYASQPYGYSYTSRYASSPAVGYSGYGYTNAPAGYGYTTTTTTGSVGNYNNHLPSQYYRSIQQSGVTGAPGAYYVGGAGNQGNQGGAVRYVTSSVQPAGVYQNQGSYRSYSSSSGSTSAGQVQPSGQLSGSNNYIVLKKRQAEEQKKQQN